ncbi:hypothetical protein G6M14_17800 [Agrobacterium tumefaciens]|uniref:hypothetical protein n=1 Tax=Agrobacterium tumefaciens TaxID=358 RepID=UPI001573993C|nr:hypothetical protein [Agrobacterium tumefaciens]
MDQSVSKKLDELRDALEGRPRARRYLAFDPAHSPIYGAISGGALPVDQFEIADGLVLRSTFAHVMSPYLMAFAEPDTPSKPHPGPWRPVSGGKGFNVRIEIALREGASPTKFDRINTVWWTISLLRMLTSIPLVLPVLSDTAFADAKDCEHEPRFWPIEMSRPRIGPIVENDVISIEQLEAVKLVFAPGAALMDIEHFNRAYQTMDGAPLAHSSGAALVMMWAAMETLFRPGQHDITRRLSKAIATHIQDPGVEREQLQQRVAKLYELRGSSVHNSQMATGEVLAETAGLARRAFAYCMGREAPPDCDALLLRWSAEHTMNKS